MMMHEALGLVDEVIMHTFIDRKNGRAQIKVSFWVVRKKFLVANAVILCCLSLLTDYNMFWKY